MLCLMGMDERGWVGCVDKNTSTETEMVCYYRSTMGGYLPGPGLV